MAALEPPRPPSKRLSRPKITLQIPDAATPIPVKSPQTASSLYKGTPRYYKPPQTPGSHISDHANPYYNPFIHMYHNKASEFMFKQFEGFKDFTMNTAKSGLSAGEKSAFWFYNKLKLLSKRWFTHFFLTLCLVLYTLIGAGIFAALEGPNEANYDKSLSQIRRQAAVTIRDISLSNKTSFEDIIISIVQYLKDYENDYSDCIKHINDNDTVKTTWTFWNSMFYAGTIFTTIVAAA